MVHALFQAPFITFAHAFATNPPQIITPQEIELAHDICPSKLGSRVLQLSSSKVLKFGVDVHLGEADAMHLVAHKTPEVSIPRVYNAYKIGNMGYIVMDYIPGPTLAQCWTTLSVEDRETIQLQLHQYISSFRQIKGTFYGTSDGGPCHSIFMHEYRPPRVFYGPFQSRQDFNKGVVRALRNSRPDPSQYNGCLEQEIITLQGDRIVFTHGDLGRGNIIFYEGKVTIIDWGAAGYSLEEREFVEVKWRASQNKEWDQLISTCIPDFTPQYEIWDRVTNEMRLFSGI